MHSLTPRFTITNAITAGLTAIERARGFLEAATLSEEWVQRMSQRALLLEAHHERHIEGTELTIEQAERLWAGETVEGVKPDDVRELLNYRDGVQPCLRIPGKWRARHRRSDPRNPQTTRRRSPRWSGRTGRLPNDPEFCRQ